MPKYSESISASPKMEINQTVSVTLLNSFSGEDQMYGAVTDFQVWNYSLLPQQINEWSKCEINLQGNVINWGSDLLGK